MKNAFLRQTADEFMVTLLKHTNHEDLTPLLQNKSKAKSFYTDLGWYNSGDYFGDITTDILSNFTTAYPQIISQYLHDQISLCKVCQLLIQDISKQKYTFDISRFYACLILYEEEVGIAVKQILLKEKKLTPAVSLLGFGLGNGYYEKQIKSFLLQQSLAQCVNLYGFDPDSHETSNDIIMLSPSQLIADPSLRFDYIIIRWVLHHIDYAERWHHLLQCLNHASHNATIIIVEEGCFPSAPRETPAIILYELLTACVDVIINAVLHPRWLQDTVQGIGPPFFISYLTGSDMHNIEQGLQFHFDRTVVKQESSLFPQTIISYRVRAPVQISSMTMSQDKKLIFSGEPI